MRSGVHPAKEAGALPSFGTHRVVVPVHIPSLDGYFAEAREVLARCLESLRLTAAGRVAVTLVSDGSCAEVVDDLRACQDAGWVDQVVLQHPNRGKVDSVLGVARASYGALASRELTVDAVVDGADLDRFAASIDRPDLFPEEWRRHQLVVRRAGVTACIGAPHWVLTLRREVLAATPPEPSRRAVGGSETRWLDEPADRLGRWRLTTARAYAHHMGNVVEPWMDEELAATRSAAGNGGAGAHPPAPSTVAAVGRSSLASRLPWGLRTRLAERVLRPRLERRVRRGR